MAPLPTINGIMRVAFSWRYLASSTTAVNVMHFLAASTDTAALNTAINANVTATMWACISGQVSCYQLAITPLDGQSATITYAQTGTKWTGGAVAGDLLPSTATIVSLKTALRGRRNRGRLYLPYPTEGVATGGTYGGTLSSLQSAWDTFRGAMKTSSFPMHVASYGHSLHRHKNTDGSYTLTPVTWTATSNEVVATTVEGTFGTQRRRQSRLR